MVKFQGTRSIQIGGMDVPPEMLSPSAEISLPEAVMSASRLLAALPVVITTTVGARLLLELQKFPYSVKGETLYYFGIRISPIDGEILTAERNGTSHQFGVISDLAASRTHIGFTHGWSYHLEVYYRALEADIHIVPPSTWKPDRLTTM